MCTCIDVEFGSYEVAIPLMNPFTNKVVSVDFCILYEIYSLWRKGIETIESCCGHNKTYGYIAVKEKHIPQMYKLGYLLDLKAEAPGCFIPKITKDYYLGGERKGER